MRRFVSAEADVNCVFVYKGNALVWPAFSSPHSFNIDDLKVREPVVYRHNALSLPQYRNASR